MATTTLEQVITQFPSLPILKIGRLVHMCCAVCGRRGFKCEAADDEDGDDEEEDEDDDDKI